MKVGLLSEIEPISGLGLLRGCIFVHRYNVKTDWAYRQARAAHRHYYVC